MTTMLGNTSCACNCRPCVCSAPSGEGCIPDLCVPRPTFFDGQLIGSEDLNAVMRYFRSRDMLLGRYAAGWGVFGGLVVDAAPGILRQKLGDPQSQASPNPQVLAGTTVEISPGVAVDAHGRTLVHCAPTILDLAALSEQVPTAPQSYECPDVISSCADPKEQLYGRLYYLVAEFAEAPSRPAPQYSGGGACDPAPTCEFSRWNEGVRFSLVPNIPETYEIFGCLEEPAIPENLQFPDCGIPEQELRQRWSEFLDVMLSVASAQCCQRPVVVLARVLFTSTPPVPAAQLPSVATYTILDNAYPARRIAPSVALNWSGTLALASCKSSGPAALAKLRFEEGSPVGTWVLESQQGISSITSVDEFTVDVQLSSPFDSQRRVVHVTPLTAAAQPPFTEGWMTTIVDLQPDPSASFRIGIVSGSTNPPSGLMLTVSEISDGS